MGKVPTSTYRMKCRPCGMSVPQKSKIEAEMLAEVHNAIKHGGDKVAKAEEIVV